MDAYTEYLLGKNKRAEKLRRDKAYKASKDRLVIAHGRRR